MQRILKSTFIDLVSEWASACPTIVFRLARQRFVIRRPIEVNFLADLCCEYSAYPRRMATFLILHCLAGAQARSRHSSVSGQRPFPITIVTYHEAG